MNTRFKIILDTNFLLTTVRYKLHGLEDIKSRVPADFFVLSGTMGELEGLSRSDKKLRGEFAIVKQIIKNEKVSGIISKLPKVDDELVEKSKEYVIATNDKALRKRIIDFGGKCIYVKKLTTIDLSDIIDE